MGQPAASRRFGPRHAKRRASLSLPAFLVGPVERSPPFFLHAGHHTQVLQRRSLRRMKSQPASTCFANGAKSTRSWSDRGPGPLKMLNCDGSGRHYRSRKIPGLNRTAQMMAHGGYHGSRPRDPSHSSLIEALMAPACSMGMAHSCTWHKHGQDMVQLLVPLSFSLLSCCL